MSENEIDIKTGRLTEELGNALLNSIVQVSDQNKITWLTSYGKRIAAIVPAEAVTPESGLYPQPEGIPVNVFAPDCSIPMLSGTLIPGAPWAFWNRVIPDGEFIDLPPMYRIKKI